MKKGFVGAILLTYLILSVLLSARAGATANPAASPTPMPSPTPIVNKTPRVASPEQVLLAQLEWERTRHANTYDNGLGANSTCALCKAPRNYNSNPVALEASHDCAACKREPGLPRPDLEGTAPVEQPDWQSISCDACHQPVGDSYSTAISYWDPLLQEYQPMANSAELCAKCHGEQHGFGVIEEQAHSPAHQGWDCARCHGGHNLPVQCTDCHDTRQGAAVVEHATHTKVGCTACHDAGELVIWQDPNAASRYAGLYMPQQTAHSLRSWPSHNLQTQVACGRCHHQQTFQNDAVVSTVLCMNALCHPEGVAQLLCPWQPFCFSSVCHKKPARRPIPMASPER